MPLAGKANARSEPHLGKDLKQGGNQLFARQAANTIVARRAAAARNSS
jgi:hypothetical protein